MGKTKKILKKSALYLIVEVALLAKASILIKQLFFLAVIDKNLWQDTTFMKFLVFIRTEFGERHWKGQANSLQEAEEQAIASIDAHNKTISDTSLRCNWHWQNNSGCGNTEHCNICGNPVYWDGEEYYCSYCALQLRHSEDSGQLYSHS